MKEMLYAVRCLKSNEDMILALAGQFLSNCLMNLKNSGDSTGFEPMTSAMPVQCSDQLSYEVTQWRENCSPLCDFIARAFRDIWSLVIFLKFLNCTRLRLVQF